MKNDSFIKKLLLIIAFLIPDVNGEKGISDSTTGVAPTGRDSMTITVEGIATDSIAETPPVSDNVLTTSTNDTGASDKQKKKVTTKAVSSDSAFATATPVNEVKKSVKEKAPIGNTHTEPVTKKEKAEPAVNATRKDKTPLASVTDTNKEKSSAEDNTPGDTDRLVKSSDTVHDPDSGKSEKSGGVIRAILKKPKQIVRKITSFNLLKRKNLSEPDSPSQKAFSPDKTATGKPRIKKVPKTTGKTTPDRDTVSEKNDSTIVKKKSPIKSISSIIPGVKETAAQDRKTEWRFFKAGKLVSALLVFLIGWLALHYLTLLMNLLSERWPQYRLLIKGFIPVVRILGWTVLLSFIIIGVFKPPIQSVLAFTASAGIAIGFASQDILKNIFGGVVILFDKPFKVGDKIQIDSFYGEVVSIGIRTVRIVTMDDSVVAVPNSEIVSKSVSNANTGEPDCQVAAEFYFEPDLDLDKAFVLAQQCAAISRYIYLNKPIAVVFKNEMHLGRNIIHMRLKAYVIDHRFEMPFITDMSRTVYREFRKAGLVVSRPSSAA